MDLNMNNNNLCLLHRAEVLRMSAISNTTLHERMNDGVMPPSVSVGPRAVRWVERELCTVLAAMIAGASDEEIRQLVAELIVARQELPFLVQSGWAQEVTV